MGILNDKDFKLLKGFSNSPEKKYYDYINKHIENVKKAYNYIKESSPEIMSHLEIPESEMDEQIARHDRSKFEIEEFQPYADHFYGHDKIPESDSKFQKAWKHHYTHNPHHPEYWQHNKMPYSCILEMICDWWSFGWENGNLYEIFYYYEKNKDNKYPFLHPETKRTILEIFDELKKQLSSDSNVLNIIKEAMDDFSNGKNIEEYLKEKNYNEALTESALINTEKELIKKFKNVQKLIEKSENIFIVRHISPDADAILSSKSLCSALETRFPKKKIVLVSEKDTALLQDNDLLFILDLAVKHRIAGTLIKKGNPYIVRFDHHPKSDITSTVDIELKQAGSTSELIVLFLSKMGYPINKKMAEDLFRGIITDTGRMQYSLSTTTLEALSILTTIGVNYKKVYNQMYIKDEDALKSKAYILSNYKKTPNGVAYLFLDKERANNAGIDLQKTSEQVYEMAEIRDCPIWVILKQNSLGEVNMRIRSRVIPINQIAQLFGGGGHENAAGLKVKNTEIAKQVLMKLDEYLKNEKLINKKLY